jgi:L-cysteine/cystine lyase
MTYAEARAEFPVLERFAYLNTGTFGPLGRSTLAAMEPRLRDDVEYGRIQYEGVLELRERVRAGVAALLGAQPDQIALTYSTTSGCNTAIAGLGLGRGDEVVTTDSEHPGLLLPLHVSGARVRVAEVGGHPTNEALERIVACVGPRTRLLALSHVLWTTGQVMPVHELKRVTGLPVLVDGAQSVGAIPVTVGELDWYTVSGQKWLCGPEPVGALYVRDAESLRTAFPSYFALSSIEPDGTFVPKEGATRFDSGWLAAAQLAGLDAALGVAPEWRYERAAEITAYCREALARAHEVVGEPGQGTLVSWVAADDPAGTARKLQEEGVIVRDLPGTGWLRASCGWWSNEEDIDRLVAALAA